MTANANATNHTANHKPKMTYRVADHALTLDGVTAYYDATLERWAREFDDTPYAVTSARMEVKQSKGGARVTVCVVPANLPSNGIYLTTNSTCSIDCRKLANAYVKRWEKLDAKGEKPARAPQSSERKCAQSVNRYASAAVKRGADGKALRTAVVNFLSVKCFDYEVQRADVLPLLKPEVRGMAS